MKQFCTTQLNSVWFVQISTHELSFWLMQVNWWLISDTCNYVNCKSVNFKILSIIEPVRNENWMKSRYFKSIHSTSKILFKIISVYSLVMRVTGCLLAIFTDISRVRGAAFPCLLTSWSCLLTPVSSSWHPPSLSPSQSRIVYSDSLMYVTESFDIDR